MVLTLCGLYPLWSIPFLVLSLQMAEYCRDSHILASHAVSGRLDKEFHQKLLAEPRLTPQPLNVGQAIK